MYLPQSPGAISGARGPERKAKRKWLKGSSGSSSKVVVELAGLGVGRDRAGGADEDAEFGVLGDHVYGEQVVGRVVVLGGDVDRAVDGRLHQRAFDFDFAELGGGRAAGFACQALFVVLGEGAGGEAIGDGGVGGDALGQGDDGLLDLRLGDAFGVGQALVFEVDFEVEPARRARRVGGRFGLDPGVEGDLVAGGEGERVAGFVGEVVAQRFGQEAFGGGLGGPGDAFEDRVEGVGAVGRQGEERGRLGLEEGMQSWWDSRRNGRPADKASRAICCGWSRPEHPRRPLWRR